MSHVPVGGPDYIPFNPWNELRSLTLSEWHSKPQTHMFWTQLGSGFYENYNWVFVWFGMLYVPLVFGGVKLMEKREPMNLGRFLTVWNFLMALFSAVGFVYALIPIRQIFNHRLGLYSWICDVWVVEQPAVSELAVFLFVTSKVFEFIDTIFLVLRKRPVIFLHWYHHVITFLFTWYSSVTSPAYSSSGYYFCLMNYFVHAWMYLYYMLVSMKIYPKWDLFITLLQLIQMVLGVVIITISMSCDSSDWTGLAFGYLLYASFFYLFVQIFQRRYVTETGFRRTASPTAAQKKSE